MLIMIGYRIKATEQEEKDFETYMIKARYQCLAKNHLHPDVSCKKSIDECNPNECTRMKVVRLPD